MFFGNQSVHLNGMTDAIDERKLLLSDKVQRSKTHGISFSLVLNKKTSQRQTFLMLATVV